MQQASDPPPPPRPADDREDHRETVRRGMWARLWVLSVIAGIGLVVAYTIGLPPFPTCAFKLVAGRPCPGCGMTRSVVNLAHFDLLTSIRYHPLGVVMAGGLAAGIGGAALGLLRGADPVWDFFERHGPRVFGGFLGAMLVIWIVRAFIVPSWAPDPITSSGNWDLVLALFR